MLGPSTSPRKHIPECKNCRGSTPSQISQLPRHVRLVSDMDALLGLKNGPEQSKAPSVSSLVNRFWTADSKAHSLHWGDLDMRASVVPNPQCHPIPIPCPSHSSIMSKHEASAPMTTVSSYPGPNLVRACPSCSPAVLFHFKLCPPPSFV